MLWPAHGSPGGCVPDFKELQDITLDLMEQEDEITRTRVKRYLNMVGADVFHRYAWAERRGASRMT